MFASKTVFVIGAGASADLGLPLGTKLRDQIASLLGQVKTDTFNLTGPNEIVDAIRRRAEELSGGVRHAVGEELNGLLAASRTIAANLPLVRSIDEFVDHYRGDERVEFMAKCAICYEIIRAEHSSKLFRSHERFGSEINSKALSDADAWILQLWYMLRAGSNKSDPRRIFENVSFIVFNYDRCLEAFLTKALVALFDVPEAEALNIVADLDVVHPYGLVSSLGNTGRAVFGGLDRVDIGLVAANIRTFAETERDAATMDRLRSMLSDAVNLVFLGYAFHEPNMDFLECDRHTQYPNVYATAVGLPEEHWPDIRLALLKRWGRTGPEAHDFRPIFRDSNGATLLRTFEKPLMR